MSIQKIFIFILLPFLFILSTCTTSFNILDASSTQSLTEGNRNHISTDVIKDAETIEETDYYKITDSGHKEKH